MSRLNLTIGLEEDLLRDARAVAARRRTSVSEMVRQFLRQVVRQDQRRLVAFDRIKHLVETAPVTLDGPLPARDELHEQ